MQLTTPCSHGQVPTPGLHTPSRDTPRHHPTPPPSLPHLIPTTHLVSHTHGKETLEASTLATTPTLGNYTQESTLIPGSACVLCVRYDAVVLVLWFQCSVPGRGGGALDYELLPAKLKLELRLLRLPVSPNSHKESQIIWQITTLKTPTAFSRRPLATAASVGIHRSLKAATPLNLSLNTFKQNITCTPVREISQRGPNLY